MKFSEYLKTRPNGNIVNALSRKEAKVCGIPWPLKKGWPTQYADLEVDEKEMRDVVSARIKRKAERTAEQRAAEKLTKLEKKAARAERRKARILKRAAKGHRVYESSDKFLESYEWRVLRMKALKRDGASCACCGATRNDGVKIHVDHIKPRKTHPELALDLNNLQVLCEVCNHGKGNWDSTDWRKKPAANDALEEEQAAHMRSIVDGRS